MAGSIDFRLTLLTAFLVALALTAVNVTSLAGVLQAHHRTGKAGVHELRMHAQAQRIELLQDGVGVTAVDGRKAVETGAHHVDHEGGGHEDHGSDAHKEDSAAVSDLQSRIFKTPECEYVQTHAEFWGDVVKWGSTNKVDSWQDCCKQCREFRPPGHDDPECNVWVYCGDEKKCGNQYKECWLKHLSHPSASKPRAEGPHIPWTSGMRTLTSDEESDLAARKKPVTDEDLMFHLVMSAQGFVTHWQARVHYHHYKKIKKQCQENPPCHMGGFTRLLHSGEADDLMDEIPTIVVDPLPDSKNRGYVVLNRPWAFIQWLRIQKIKEKNILMVEPDHIMLQPIPNMMRDGLPAAFPFFYIEPAKPENADITRKFVGHVSRKELEKIAPIGNSPTFIALEDFKKMAEPWLNTTIKIFEDPQANKAWGWVLEMYGFTIAEYNAKIGPISLHLDLMSQPPWDDKLANFKILHYTYGQDFNEQGKFTPGKVGYWHWDKRDWMGKPVPRNIPLPPKGCTNQLTIKLISSINEASEALPCWDEYATTRRVHVKNEAGQCVMGRYDRHRRSSMEQFAATNY